MSDKIFLQRPSVGLKEMELVKQVIMSKNLVEGKMVRELERTIAEYVGVNYAIACTSATTGLELALRAVGIKPQDEVVVPDFTHPATALVVLTLSAHPVLVDVDLESYNATVEIIEKAITSKTKAIILVSQFGNPLDMAGIMRMVDTYHIPVIEDAACSLGSEYFDGRVGSHADLSVFSFHPRKIFTVGDGGMVVTNNAAYHHAIESMKRFGIDSGKFVTWGTNYRMSDILGAVALGQIKRIHEILANRRVYAYYYDALLKGVKGVRIPKIRSDSKSNYQTYCVFIKSKKRDVIIAEMKRRGIQTQIGAYALHTLPVFEKAKREGTLSNSKTLSEHLLALPLHHELTDKDQQTVVRTLKGLL